MVDQKGRKIRVSDIAAKAGVSAAVVSRFLNTNGYVPQEKSAAITQALQELGAKVPLEPPAVRGQNRRVFAFLSPPLANRNSYQYAAMSSFFSDTAKAKGYSTKVYPVCLTDTPLIQALTAILKDHPSGIFIPVVPMRELDRATQRFIEDCDIPIVFLSEFLHPYPQIHSIINNVEVGISMSIAHLREQGCRNLALLTPTTAESKSAALQQAAFRTNTREESWLHGCAIYEYPRTPSGFAASGYQCAKLAFSKDPSIDGIIGWTDSYTAGILWYLYEIGKRVPDDVKLIAQNEEYAPFLCPPLTSFSFSNHAICSEAVDMLVRLQSKKERQNVKHVYLRPSFSVRASTNNDMTMILPL